MTPAEFRATLAALGWTVRGLARVLGRPENTVGNWGRPSYSVPADVAEWLARRLACLRADPPPVVKESLTPPPTPAP